MFLDHIEILYNMKIIYLYVMTLTPLLQLSGVAANSVKVVWKDISCAALRTLFRARGCAQNSADDFLPYYLKYVVNSAH